MNRIKNFNATGIAPDGRLYAGDLNLLQDLVAALSDYTQNLGVGTLAVGDSSLLVSKFGTGEIQISAAVRALGIIRATGGFIGGSYTTAARDAIAAGSRPYGLVILNTTTNRYEWNKGTDATPDWQPLNPPIAASSITATELAAGAVTSAKILDGTIVDTDLAADTITSRVIAADAVGSSEIAASAVGTSEIADGAVATAKVADGAITSIKIADGTIVGADLANDTITATQIAADAVGASEIAAGAVGSSEIADGSVTAAELAPQTIDVKAAGYTLVASDRFKAIRMDGGGTLTVPTDAAQAFAVGESVDVIQWGAGQVTIAGASGVTVVGYPGLKTAAQYTIVTLVKIAVNTWMAAGALTV